MTDGKWPNFHGGARGGTRGDEASVRRDFWPKIRRALGRIPFAEELIAAYYCTLDPATPAHAKAILLGALAYFIMPVDLVPDFAPLLGFTDDATVLFMAINRVRRHIRPEHLDRARAFLASGRN
ncbi:MAG: YkvA family protein [Proteobacteria bacterium]|nr:YkvA family protein [Pseudomonadota bacterium]